MALTATFMLLIDPTHPLYFVAVAYKGSIESPPSNEVKWP
jgi:hypothetical protein